MMKAPLLNVVSLLSERKSQGPLALAAIAVNLVGFILVYRQIALQSVALQSTASANLTELSFDVLAFIGERPHLYPYFYESKPLSADHEHRVEVLICCEMIANYCENVIEQRDSMSEEQWVSWRRFIQGQFASSLALRSFVAEYRDWYAEELLRLSTTSGDRPTSAPEAANEPE